MAIHWGLTTGELREHNVIMTTAAGKSHQLPSINLTVFTKQWAEVSAWVPSIVTWCSPRSHCWAGLSWVNRHKAPSRLTPPGPSNAALKQRVRWSHHDRVSFSISIFFPNIFFSIPSFTSSLPPILSGLLKCLFYLRLFLRGLYILKCHQKRLVVR